jgi:hypothetical protein
MHSGSVMNKPKFHLWSAAFMIQTPLINRVAGKKNAQNNNKSTSKAKKRGQRPA